MSEELEAMPCALSAGMVYPAQDSAGRSEILHRRKFGVYICAIRRTYKRFKRLKLLEAGM